jgi:hypothetical protein
VCLVTSSQRLAGIRGGFHPQELGIRPGQISTDNNIVDQPDPLEHGLKGTIGPQGWGYALSAESLGLIATAVVMLRRQLRRPLFSGMLGVSLLALPIIVLGVYPQVAPS